MKNKRPYPRHDRNTRKMTQPYAMHEPNPAGSKRERRIAKTILRAMKEPTPSSKLSYERAVVVRKKYDASLQPLVR